MLLLGFFQILKFLGVILDSLWSWFEHIDYVSSTISKCIGVLRRVIFYVSSHA